MKTRIKIVTLKNGSKRYYPQYKGWFFWKSFREYRFEFTYIQALDTMTEAQRVIDKHLSYEKMRDGLKHVKTEYVKYP